MVQVIQQRDDQLNYTLSGIVPKKYTVHVLSASNLKVEAGPGNIISRVKCVGTATEWVVVDLYDLDGEVIKLGLFIDEADEVMGPFSKVVYSNTGQSTASATSIQALVWEKNNG